jgi:hypothetical protein
MRLHARDLGSPRSVTVPERTVTSPNIALMSVDLPAPVGADDADQLAFGELERAPVQDVHAGDVAGDLVVGDEQWFGRQ